MSQQLFNENRRVNIRDLPARATRPSDDELDQIFGGGWWNDYCYALEIVDAGVKSVALPAVNYIVDGFKELGTSLVGAFSGW